MKIISYNVNGIRAAIKKGFLEWLKAANPDVICIQETKAQQDQVDAEVIKSAGYPYQYWFSAQKKGYSGVAIFCKQEPNHIEYGTGIETMDFEGRNIRVDYDNVSVMSMYLPSGTNDLRLDFNEVYKRTNTSYKPIKLSNDIWLSDYKSAASVERVEAFIKLGRPDPVQYGEQLPEGGIRTVKWEEVKESVQSVLDSHKS